MADISVLARLLNGAMRNVDLTNNTPVVLSIKVGGGTNTELTKAILDRLVSLQNGSDVDATYHTHDGRYFTETELSSATASSGSDLIGDDDTYSNFTPAAATIKGALSGIDSALAATADEKVGISAADTTPGYLAAKIQVDIGTNTTNALEESILNPAGDETLRIRFDASKVDHGTLTGLGNDDHTQYIKVDGSRDILSTDGNFSIKKATGDGGSYFGTDNDWAQIVVQAYDGVTLKNQATIQSLNNSYFGNDAINERSVVESYGSSALSEIVVAAKQTRMSTLDAKVTFEQIDTQNYDSTQFGEITGVGADMEISSTTGKVVLKGTEISVDSKKITNLADPTLNQDAATKAYVDAVALGLKPKAAALVSTTANITLSGTQTIDGIAVVAGNRVLVKDQTAALENGIYIVAAGAWSRSNDFDSLTPIDEVNGAWIPVQLGTQAGRIYVQYGTVATIGTDPINFEFYNPLASLVGGDMISVSGSTIAVDLLTNGGLKSSNPGNAAGQLQVNLEASNPSLQINGSNELKVKLDGAGAITSGASGLAAQVDNSTVEISSNALRVKDAGIVLAKLASNSVDENKIVSTSFNVAGAITGGSGSKLAVQVDGSTIEINTNALRVKAAGITESHLAASVAGNGLSGGAGSALAVNVDDSTIEINTDSLRVKDLGITTAKLAATSVTAAKLGSDVAGSGLSGGNGSALTVSSAPALRAESGEVAGEAFSAATIYAVRYGQNAETAGRIYKADLDATSTDNFYAIGLTKTVGALSAADAMPAITKAGLITLTGHGFTVGKPVYLSASGAITSTAPTTTNYAVVKVGMVKDANAIEVQIQLIGVN